MAKKNPNGHISVEKFDDVAFEDDNLSKCLTQAKHSVTAGSLDDKSVDLWKTIRVWMAAVEEGIVQLGSVKFFLITTNEASEDSAAALLRSGHGKEAVEQAYKLLLKAAKQSKNKTTEIARNKFSTLKKPEAIALLSKVEIIDLHPNLGDVSSEIEGELIVIDPVQVTAIAQHLEGWWFDVLGKRLVDDKTATIPVQQILMKVSEIGKSFGDSALPLSDVEELGAKEYSPDDESETFVRQMRVLELPNSMVERGAGDYYKAYAQRSKWARESLILDDELARFDAKLSDRWERKFDEDVLLADPKSSEEEITVGRKLFLWASKDSQPLRNVVETWITAGSYHGLSNRLKIGWHPKFKTLFRTESDDGGS